jgi:hypothetical protein
MADTLKLTPTERQTLLCAMADAIDYQLSLSDSYHTEINRDGNMKVPTGLKTYERRCVALIKKYRTLRAKL